jgi:hypothetical protein
MREISNDFLTAQPSFSNWMKRCNYLYTGMTIFRAATVLSPRRSSALSLPLIDGKRVSVLFVLIEKSENCLVNNKISLTVV